MFRCSCGYLSSVRAKLEVAEVANGKPFSNKTNSSDFEINNHFFLGLQIGGSGRKEAKIIPGLLNLSNGFMAKQCTELQDELR
jgi:hypothetical protein